MKDIGSCRSAGAPSPVGGRPFVSSRRGALLACPDKVRMEGTHRQCRHSVIAVTDAVVLRPA